MDKNPIQWAAETEIPNPCAKSLLNTIARRIGKNQCCWPSYKTLSKESGLAYSTVAKYMRLLKHFGFIKVIPRYRPEDSGRTTSHIYLAMEKAAKDVLWLVGRRKNRHTSNCILPTLPGKGNPLYSENNQNRKEGVSRGAISTSKAFKLCSSGTSVRDDSWLNPPPVRPERVNIAEYIRSKWDQFLTPADKTFINHLQFQ